MKKAEGSASAVFKVAEMGSSTLIPPGVVAVVAAAGALILTQEGAGR